LIDVKVNDYPVIGIGSIPYILMEDSLFLAVIYGKQMAMPFPIKCTCTTAKKMNGFLNLNHLLYYYSSIAFVVCRYAYLGMGIIPNVGKNAKFHQYKP